MKETFRNAISLILPLIFLLLSGFLFLTGSRHFPFLSKMIAAAAQKQKKLETRIQNLKQEMEEKRPQLLALQSIRRNSISADTADFVGTFRSRAEQDFYSSGAQVRTISTPRQLKGVPGIELYEINLTAEIRISELVSVLEALNKPPALLWRSVFLRPNNVINPEYLNINAVLGAVCFREKTAAKMEKEGKP